MTRASSGSGTVRSRRGSRSRRARSAATARAAFGHAVFCVSTAPAAISYGLRPGPQRCAPRRRRRLPCRRNTRALVGSRGGPGIRRQRDDRAVTAEVVTTLVADRVLALIVLLQTLTLAVSGPATSPEYLPIWVAAADGHFERQGLRVTLRATRSEVGAAEALAQSQADLAATSLEALLRFGMRDGQNPRLLLGLTAAPPVVLAVDSGQAARLRGIGDLAG